MLDHVLVTRNNNWCKAENNLWKIIFSPRQVILIGTWDLTPPPKKKRAFGRGGVCFSGFFSSFFYFWQKKFWWVVYGIDRTLGIIIGRPIGHIGQISQFQISKICYFSPYFRGFLQTFISCRVISWLLNRHKKFRILWLKFQMGVSQWVFIASRASKCMLENLRESFRFLKKKKKLGNFFWKKCSLCAVGDIYMFMYQN